MLNPDEPPSVWRAMADALIILIRDLLDFPIGGDGQGWALVPLAALIAVSIYFFLRSPRQARKRFWWLALLPIMLLFDLDWAGAVILLNPPPPPAPGNYEIMVIPLWMRLLRDYSFLVFVLIGLISAIIIRHGRRFALSCLVLVVYADLMIRWICYPE